MRHTKDARAEVDNLRDALHLVVLVALQDAFLPSVVPTEMVPPLHYCPKECPLFSGAPSKSKHEHRQAPLRHTTRRGRVGAWACSRPGLGPGIDRTRILLSPPPPFHPRSPRDLRPPGPWRQGARAHSSRQARKAPGHVCSIDAIFPRGPAAAPARIHASAQILYTRSGSGRLGTNRMHPLRSVSLW